MASKVLRAITYQGTRKVEAGYKPSHTTETLIGYTACYVLVVIYFRQFTYYMYRKNYSDLDKFNDSEIFFAIVTFLSPFIIAIPFLISALITGIV